MARIFSIYFTHDEILHSAIVSVRTTTLFTEYILGNLDDELRKALPSTVVMTTGSGLRFQNATASHPPAPMNAIIAGIASHLRAGNDVRTSL